MRALQQAWAAAPYCNDTMLFLNAGDLARKFRCCLQEQMDLIEWGINKDWVEENFPLFCRSLGGKVVDQPHYAVFANRLAEVMDRRRRDVWGDGVRLGTITLYWVPDPGAAVVELAAAKRKRA